MPTIVALARARRHLDKRRANGVTLIATGGLRTESDFVKAMALGADGIAVANSALQAIGCLGMRACHTNNCPVGIATQKPGLRRRLEIDKSAQRLERYLTATTELMRILARACGHDRLSGLCDRRSYDLRPSARRPHRHPLRGRPMSRRPGVHLAALLLAGAPGLSAEARPFVIVLGIAQDGGFPQAGHRQAADWSPNQRRRVSSLGLVNPSTGERWLFDATPDLPLQLWALDQAAPPRARPPALAGVFVTHGHIGHYTGLMYFGREAMGARSVRVYAMPRMQAFLRLNGPWDQLVRLQNIEIAALADGRPVRLDPGVTVTPFVVPHRDEYTETVGFEIRGPRRAVAFVPDIDKWSAWGPGKVQALLRRVDVAYLDGTFYADGEIPGRAMRDIPHPFIVESIARFKSLPAEQRRKVRFIHLNRTNPALRPNSAARRRIREAGMRVAKRGERIRL